MKVFTFVLAILALGCPNLSIAHNDLVKICYKGSDLMAKHLVKGHVNLYVSNQYEKKRVTGPLYRKRKVVYVKRYFLKCRDQIEKVSPYNYKKLLKAYLPNAPELHRRLGRLGFRYQNIPSIIRYYNTFRVPEIEATPGREDPVLEIGWKKD